MAKKKLKNDYNYRRNNILPDQKKDKRTENTGIWIHFIFFKMNDNNNNNNDDRT